MNNALELKCLELSIEGLEQLLRRRLLTMKRRHSLKVTQNSNDIAWAIQRLKNKQSRLIELAVTAK
jgi:hypothetical protein